eukprot:CAMPEP_0197032528 /NCGR_PEP_ID=MMETSP1384-20130603/11194_1 /TAXON_ID=29189 /ORGANISM="Ammonia sp." /LENGTH=321 /DNA_ID=CAMNT_0042462211 /DNA_START=101 /DNA_END=1066 /DNA_ORIENTATION=+
MDKENDGSIAQQKTSPPSQEPPVKKQKISPPPTDTANESANAKETNKATESTDSETAHQLSPQEVPKDIKELIENETLEDEEGNELKVKSVRYLEPQRIEIYSTKHKILKTAKHVLAVECVPDDSDEDDDQAQADQAESDVKEKIFAVDAENAISEIRLEDKILMEDLPISSCVEYTFYDDGPWFVGEISLQSLEYYKQCKFAEWRKQIQHPVCEAAFKRLLCIGLITNIFDRFVFTSPEEEKKEYVVQDDHGKNVDIPRPVNKLRIWNVGNRCYESVSPQLKGAPDAKEAEKYWQDMLQEFRETRGEDYINGLLQSFETQ